MSNIKEWMSLPEKREIDGKLLEIPPLNVSQVAKFMRMTEEEDPRVKADLMQELLKACLKLVFKEAKPEEIESFPLDKSIMILNEIIEVSGLKDDKFVGQFKAKTI